MNVSIDSILNMDATSTARAISEGELTSEEAVHAYIDHIKQINPALNAMVEERFTEALAEAKKLDTQSSLSTEKGPLYGVPISVKEAYNVTGMKTTGGLVHLQDLMAKNDAEVVAKLKEAGAIVLGKTNTPALCFCQETDNKLYGRTNNPWDLTRTAGGSSGGEGSLLAAGGAAVGIGSDIGGSIRFPSHFNGVVGFKPGRYQVPAEGHFPPITLPLQERMLGLGPMGKSVRDMRLMYDIMAENTPLEKSLNDFQLDILPSNTTYPLSEKSKDVLQQIKAFLEKTFSIREATPAYLEESALLWQEIMSVDGGESVKKVAFPADRTSPLLEYMKDKLTGKSDVHPYLSWALTGAKLFKPSAKRKREIQAMLDNGDQHLEKYLQNRILIFPVYHQGALKHGEVYNEIFSIRKTFLNYMPFVAYANVWGLPALTIPVGTDEEGMPISVQLISINGNEEALFQLGEVVEKELRGYVRSTAFEKSI